jgi:hypothetical protein
MKAAVAVLQPAIAPLALVGLCCTPVSLIGCADRGLCALLVAGRPAAAAFMTAAATAAGARVGRPPGGASRRSASFRRWCF